MRFFFRGAQNLFANFLRYIRGYGARVRLLFGNAVAGQKINNSLCLDLEFAGQFVNPDLICVAHALRSELRLGLFRRLLAAFFSGLVRFFLRATLFLGCWFFRRGGFRSRR